MCILERQHFEDLSEACAEVLVALEDDADDRFYSVSSPIARVCSKHNRQFDSERFYEAVEAYYERKKE